MNALTLLSLALLVVAARTFHWRHRFFGWERLWRFRSGPITVELRRHAHLARLARTRSNIRSRANSGSSR